MMDNRIYNVSSDVTGRNSSIIDGIVPHSSMSSLVQSSYSFDLNNQNHMMSLVPVLSNFHGETHVIDSHPEFNESNPPFGRRHNVRESSFVCSSFTDNPVFHGAPSCPASISSLLASRGSLQEELNNLAISTISAIPNNCSETDYVPNNNNNSLFGNSVNCGYDELLHSMNSQWEVNKYSSGTTDFGEWLPSNAASELALTLATSTPMDLRNQQSSDAGRSGTVQPGSNQNSSSNSEEHSRSYASSCKRPQLSQVICGSRYLHVVQEILSDIATYSLENLDHSCFSSAWHATAAMDADFEAHNDPALRKQDIKTTKEKLLSLLQMLDECYNQCVDEIHTVVSAFHAATDSDPHIHARFALQTISVLYKNLRERISTHFLTIGANSSPTSPSESERSYEIQKQLALQHLKKKDHQIWRPQRGLPERSVSVLRAWMFQNFLHPYPKDAEKHVLAVKSGLTRNQVSNWFINARVRLWKPMIEEMYAEMNRRKIRQNDSTERNLRGHHHMTINNHKFGIN